MAQAPVAALFVRADSVYKSMPGVDAWDAEREHTPPAFAEWLVEVARRSRVPQKAAS